MTTTTKPATSKLPKPWHGDLGHTAVYDAKGMVVCSLPRGDNYGPAIPGSLRNRRSSAMIVAAPQMAALLGKVLKHADKLPQALVEQINEVYFSAQNMEA